VAATRLGQIEYFSSRKKKYMPIPAKASWEYKIKFQPKLKSPRSRAFRGYKAPE
jgi:hypothetical protein